MADVGKLIDDFSTGLQKVSKRMPEFTQTFMGFVGAANEDSALSVKDKELVAVGISVHSRCDYCIAHHVHKAFEVGATSEEILDAAKVAIGMGGGPAMAYTATLVINAIEEFEGDFER
ncbi:MAG TPA: carboxymuconolactone decarboxylase family protein [Clostridia bacterium]|nr:carboxymuconolactone decarboxylase family protein [Clostridia bacterium]